LGVGVGWPPSNRSNLSTRARLDLFFLLFPMHPPCLNVSSCQCISSKQPHLPDETIVKGGAETNRVDLSLLRSSQIPERRFAEVRLLNKNERLDRDEDRQQRTLMRAADGQTRTITVVRHQLFVSSEDLR
jgi:hypothetical protein